MTDKPSSPERPSARERIEAAVQGANRLIPPVAPLVQPYAVFVEIAQADLAILARAAEALLREHQPFAPIINGVSMPSCTSPECHDGDDEVGPWPCPVLTSVAGPEKE